MYEKFLSLVSRAKQQYGSLRCTYPTEGFHCICLTYTNCISRRLGCNMTLRLFLSSERHPREHSEAAATPPSHLCRQRTRPRVPPAPSTTRWSDRSTTRARGAALEPRPCLGQDRQSGGENATPLEQMQNGCQWQ